jgi:hypothetical protein
MTQVRARRRRRRPRCAPRAALTPAPLPPLPPPPPAAPQVFRCAACLVDSSGEVSFAQHCLGKAHRRAAGRAGFVGIVPNAAGIEPRCSDELLNACAGVADAGGRKGNKAAAPAAAAASSGGKGVPPRGEPSVVSVGLSAAHHANIRSALLRSASETELATAAAPHAGRGAHGAGARPAGPAAAGFHKSNSLPAFAPAPAHVTSASAQPPPLPRARPGARPLPVPLTVAAPAAQLAAASFASDAAAAGAGLPAPRVEVFRRGGASGGGTAAPYVPPHMQASSGARLPPQMQASSGARLPPLPPAPLGPVGDSRERASMQQQRAALPAAAYEARICAAVAQNQVVIVEGETGCGKTTQVPQFILDEASASGQRCSIVCTQPRRISAIGVAERVAAERCERIGGTVGYSIRLESATSSATRLLFCTTGILLRRLEEDPQLATVSHVLVDEVHERSMESDFLLMVLRGLLLRRRDLRLVLMSATINAGLFASYFGAGTPTISIPGRTFPVTALYLEDALELTGHRVRASADWARKGSKGGGSSRYGGGGGGDSVTAGGLCFDFTQGRCDRGARCRFSHEAPAARPTAPAVAPAFGSQRSGGGASGGGGVSLASRCLGGAPGSVAASDADDESLSEAELAERYPRYSAGTHRALAALDHSQIDYELLQDLISWIMSQGAVDNAQAAVGGASSSSGAADDAWDAEPPKRSGAGGVPASGGGGGDCILVFLPGLKEITAAHEQLTGWGPLASEPQRSWVLPLHGSLTSEEQRRIFQRPPPGARKIVLATNIAETSMCVVSHCVAACVAKTRRAC